MSIKISKISYFSFSFKLNEKSVVKKYSLKRQKYDKLFARIGGLIFNRGWKYFKNVRIDKKEVEKSRGGGGDCDPQRNYAANPSDLRVLWY